FLPTSLATSRRTAIWAIGPPPCGWHRACSRVPREAPMLTTVGLLSLLTAHTGVPAPRPVSLDYRPRVEVWTDRGDDPYASGQGVRVHFRAEQDAYVTILRVDTDGRVRVVFPRQPWEDNFARLT